MTNNKDIHDIMTELKTRGQEFATATVVRTVSVTSAKAGAKAIILGDGTITDGWIGGGCARGAVLKAAREALDDGEPRLISVQPEDLLAQKGVDAGEHKDGIKYARNMCPSQGSMDIFVEAVRPKPELVIFGASPVAVATAMLAKPLGFSVTVCAPKQAHGTFHGADTLMEADALTPSNGLRFIVISTQGSGDEQALKTALGAKSEFVSFVGSRKKAAKLQEKLISAGMEDHHFEHFKAPAGLDIKAVTPEEIALSILAEIVHKHRSRKARKTVISETQTAQNTTERTKGFFASVANNFSTKNIQPQSQTKPDDKGVSEPEEINAFLMMRGPCC